MSDSQACILVVDDAPLMRRMLEEVLHKFGYNVESAEDGQQAIDYFLHHRPDLILMDADMPTLDGVTACARIRELPEAKYLPIIIVTAFIGREWVDRAYAAGATDYVTKPVNWDVLRNRIHYILQAKQAEEALFDEKEKAQVTLASIGDGVITTDAQGNIEYLNPVASKLTGWSTEDAQGKPLNDVFKIIREQGGEIIAFPIHQCLEQGEVVELTNNSDTVLLHRNNKQSFAIEDSAAPIRDRNGKIIGVVLVFHDVTETRKMTQELSFQAKHDALTGLYNRHEFTERLKNLLNQNRSDPHQHALLYLDLDQFKIVNDTCGHDAGDQLLKDISLSLRQTVGKYHTTYLQATLARLGGDEFALLLENCTQENALDIAHELCETVKNIRFFWSEEGHLQKKRIFTLGISIGLVPISLSNSNQKSVLAMADAACYAAKNAGRNKVHIYHDDDLIDEIEWISLLNDALEKNQGLHIFYQPIIRQNECTRDEKNEEAKTEICYEILLRMIDPAGQLVPPGAFLSTAARYNLMPTLDQWVVRTFLNWLAQHPEQLKHLKLACINISSYSLSDKSFLDNICQYLNDTTVPLEKICFEITETAALTNLSATQHFMKELNKFGCHFALDNFGSGIAAFLYLRDLPIEFLKIDGSLIKNMQKEPVNYALVKSINEIAHLMHWQTIAEFVENEMIFTQVSELQIDYIQGYWIAQPQPLITNSIPQT